MLVFINISILNWNTIFQYTFKLREYSRS